MKYSKLVAMESMCGTERLAEALALRGFLVKVEDDFIVFEKGSGNKDRMDAQNLLDRLNIPTFWKEDRFQLLTHRFPISLMKKIIRTPGRGHEVWITSYHAKWKCFAQRRFGLMTNALDLDPHTAMMVKALNIIGVTTLAGCNGHHRYAPNFQLSGPFNGAWLEVIKERYLSNLTLNYNWKVSYHNRTGACFYAGKKNEECWKMKEIFEDCVQMAQELLLHAKEIRELKQKNFKRKKMKEQAEMNLSNKKDLVKWMEASLINQ